MWSDGGKGAGGRCCNGQTQRRRQGIFTLRNFTATVTPTPHLVDFRFYPSIGIITYPVFTFTANCPSSMLPFVSIQLPSNSSPSSPSLPHSRVIHNLKAGKDIVDELVKLYSTLYSCTSTNPAHRASCPRIQAQDLAAKAIWLVVSAS